jgi:hypothetical protein
MKIFPMIWSEIAARLRSAAEYSVFCTVEQAGTQDSCFYQAGTGGQAGQADFSEYKKKRRLHLRVESAKRKGKFRKIDFGRERRTAGVYFIWNDAFTTAVISFSIEDTSFTP